MSTETTTPGDRISAACDPLEPKAMALLDELREHLTSYGVPSTEPVSMCDDEHRWTFDAGTAPRRCSVDVTVEVEEDGDSDGINFMFTVARWGKNTIQVISPYNFTEDCWVSAGDLDAVAKRWNLFERQVRNTLVHTAAVIENTIANY